VIQITIRIREVKEDISNSNLASLAVLRVFARNIYFFSSLKIFLAFGELEASAGAGAAVLFTFNHARVASKITVCA